MFHYMSLSNRKLNILVHFFEPPFCCLEFYTNKYPDKSKIIFEDLPPYTVAEYCIVSSVALRTQILAFITVIHPVVETKYARLGVNFFGKFHQNGCSASRSKTCGLTDSQPGVYVNMRRDNSLWGQTSCLHLEDWWVKMEAADSPRVFGSDVPDYTALHLRRQQSRTKQLTCWVFWNQVLFMANNFVVHFSASYHRLLAVPNL
jgi:hypothetical protein